ncbi:RCC1 domain-containing protein 1 [Excalfactoria chinensis]|uniref:RCC1 domain-containing protein 1 n=1 Tax=Excalfactoria chinensis TaxID=46218 RepID=UPI003B3BA7EA
MLGWHTAMLGPPRRPPCLTGAPTPHDALKLFHGGSASRPSGPARSLPPPPPAMAAPRRSWFAFGLSAEEAAGGDAGPGRQRLESSGSGGIRRVCPAWSYAVLETGSGLEVLSAGRRRRLPEDCEAALPSETHVVLLRGAALEAWPRLAALRGELRGDPAWSRALPPGPRPALPLLPDGFVAPRPPFYTALHGAPPLRALALGHEHVVGLGEAGEVYGWGGGRHGQLGHGSLESEQQPRLVEALGGVPMRAVAAGGWHSACISDGGDLYVWGWNESGQLGLPSRAVAEEQGQDEDVGAGLEDPLLPGEPPGAAFISIQAFPALLDLPLEPAVAAVSCGSRHTAAVTRGGELYTWGWGKYGQLGHGDRASCDQPRRVEQLWAEGLQAQEVVCGPWSTYVCVLQQGGAQGSHPPSTAPALQAGTERGSCPGELSPQP